MKNILNLKSFFGKKSKVALVLGSGAARGLAHIGVVKALDEKKVPVDMIVGSSMGALVGAYYARKGGIKGLEKVSLEIDWRKLLHLADPNLAFMLKGFVHGEKVKELLTTLIGDIQFEDLKIPLAVIATDANTGEEVLIRKGSVVDAVRASISIPVVFMPVKFGNRFLVDGGIVNPIPINAAKKMGATFVIACNAIQPLAKREAAKKNRVSGGRGRKSVAENYVPIKRIPFTALNSQINAFIQENAGKIKNIKQVINDFKKNVLIVSPRIDTTTPGIFDVLIRAIYAMEYKIVESQVHEADVLIEPDTSRIATLDFHRGKEAILEGYKAGRNALLHTKKFFR